MVRKTTFTRDDVVSAALAVIDAEGLLNFTARKVAFQLGASTAPVYSNFSNMDELAAAAKMVAVEILMELMDKPDQDQQFIHIGEGVLLFARKHPHLYDSLFLQPATKYDPGPQVMARILEKMATIDELKPLPPMERLILLKKMALFTHGMATEICNGFLDHAHWRELFILMEEVGDALVASALNCPPRNEKDLDTLGMIWTDCTKSSFNHDNPQPEGDSDE